MRIKVRPENQTDSTIIQQKLSAPSAGEMSLQHSSLVRYRIMIIMNNKNLGVKHLVQDLIRNVP